MRQLRLPLLSLNLLLVASVAHAQEEPADASGASPTVGAERPEASAYVEKLQNGIRLAVARDFEGAQAALREAVELNPSKSDAYYLLAEIHRMQGRMEDALHGFQTAARVANQGNDDRLKGRSLRGIAGTLELMEGRLADAREAWTEYASFADAHRAVANPEVARARIQALDAQSEQAQSYIEVRQRITERERVNAEPQPPSNRRPRQRTP